MNENYKEVYFNEYCETCKHSELSVTQEPCNECLGVPARQYSHKPEKWEEKDE